MSFNANPLVLSALFFIGIHLPASAQTPVYKCESGGGTVTYSEKNCRGRIINTDDAPAPVRQSPKSPENQAMAQAMTPRAGESAEQFEKRRRRARMMPTDREECGGWTSACPWKRAASTNPDPEEASKAQEALGKSRKRFGELRC